jgi:two-component system phosphate regulon sensor histidine kinase PhoR
LYAQTEIERHKLEQILTRVRDGVVVYNADGVILLINQTVRKAFELGEEKLAGKNIEKVFKDRELLGAIKGGVTDLVGVETEGKDGHVYNVNVTTVPEVGTVSTLRDISYLKELDNLKNDFITTVSHDLRSPLTSILGYVDLIERSGEVNKQQAEFIQRVKMSAHSITDLINDLLNLGRIEGSFKENIQPVSIASIMQQSLEDHISQFENHEQSVSIDISKNLPLVNGDPLQLRQMIDNLLGNAVKYTPSKGKIHVVAKQEDDQVVIQVTDSGPGIPLEEQTKIFEKFYRAKNVDEKIPGTGLGLAITKSIVENHRGRIWVKSEVGKGSTFSVVLPIAISK